MMRNDESPKERLKLPLLIDRSKLAEVLRLKGASSLCPSCGQNDWVLGTEAAFVPQWVGKIPAPGIPVSVAICNNCGFVRLHSLSALDLLPEAAKSLEEEGAKGVSDAST